MLSKWKAELLADPSPPEQDCSPQPLSQRFAPSPPACSDGTRPLLMGECDAA